MASGYYRFPTIHQETIVFVCEDDLWTVPSKGGVARRLTSNLGEVSQPSLSPDGKWIAFTGREEGQSEIYSMPAIGGPALRLTYFAAALCRTAGWTPDGKIVFASSFGHWDNRFSQLYTVCPDGNQPSGKPELLPFGLARTISYGPNGSVVIGRNSGDPAYWKRYQGGTAGRLWVSMSGQVEDFQPLIHVEGNIASPLWLQASPNASRIYFISDFQGVGNLYSCLPDGQDLTRHSDHEDYYVRNASTDGERIVYHAGGEIFLFDPTENSARKVAVEFHSPQTQRSRRFVDAVRYLEGYNLRPDGEAVTITSRGKLFSLHNWEGSVTQHPSADSYAFQERQPSVAVRLRLPRWLKDGARIVAVSDEGGEEKIIVFHSDNAQAPRLFADLEIGRPVDLVVNPKKDQILLSNHRYELLCLDLESGELKLIERSRAKPLGGFCWSPDGRWAAYSSSISSQQMAIKLWDSQTGEIHQVTNPVLRDIEPAFDPKGRYLYFLSFRHFEPVYDSLQFDLNFPRGMKPCLITLQKDLPSPFILQPKQMGKAADKPEIPDLPEEEIPDVAEKENQPPEEESEEHLIQIDMEGITSRVIAFPVYDGLFKKIRGTDDGKVVFSRYAAEGDTSADLFSPIHKHTGSLQGFNFKDLREETLVQTMQDFEVNFKGDSLIYENARRLRVICAGEKADERGSNGPSRKSGWLDLSRIKVPVSPPAEWRQMFREAWRLQRDNFWTPDMSAVDWISVHDRYLPLVERAASRSEFSDLMWEMQGELSTSHCYEMLGDYRPEPRYEVGLLGADYTYEAETDTWRISHITRGDAWDTESNSPLSASGVNVQAGDQLLAIHGRKLSRTLSPWEALLNLAGEEVAIQVQKPGEENPRQITVKTLRSEAKGHYRQWVESNRAWVQQATGGRVGYVHIPDMGMHGYAEFHRGYLAEVEREGLVVDLRWNRGGHVSALLLEKLARRRLGYDQARWNEYPSPYPQESVEGPIVALTNEFAGSDGDIFAHAFKLMKLGPLVGKRTWGGVIGIEPRHILVDGTVTTQPEYSFWFQDVGWGVENYGTDPDIEVDLTPRDYANQDDRQLARAVEEIQRLLEANPPRKPVFLEKPSRAVPKLPKR